MARKAPARATAYLHDSYGVLWSAHAGTPHTPSRMTTTSVSGNEMTEWFELLAHRASVRDNPHDTGTTGGRAAEVIITAAPQRDRYGPYPDLTRDLRDAYERSEEIVSLRAVGAYYPTETIIVDPTKATELHTMQWTWQRVAVRWKFFVTNRWSSSWRIVTIPLATRRFTASPAAVANATTATIRALSRASKDNPAWPCDGHNPARRAVWLAAAQSCFAEHLRAEQAGGLLAAQLAGLVG